MDEKALALRLADRLEKRRLTRWVHATGQTPRASGYVVGQDCAEAAAELRRLHVLVTACEPYLKEDETPAERIERERGDTEAVCRLYAKEREKNVELLEALRSIAKNTCCDRCQEAALVARAAIAKAEGEQI